MPSPITGIDPELLGRLSSAPMSAEAWRAALVEHEAFVRGARPGAGSRWQVLEVAGLPLAVWTGSGSERGKQLNLTERACSRVEVVNPRG